MPERSTISMSIEYGKQKKLSYNISSWQLEDLGNIYQLLEKPNWAPWLVASEQSLAGRVKTFPQGQLLVKSSKGMPLASLSMNRISWNGDPSTLPSWDNVAGDPTTYEHTFKSHGNTLVMMSMNVSPNFQGTGLARKLIEEAKKIATELDINNLIGSFRPNQYGEYKLQHLEEEIGFETYCNTYRDDGLPIDSWLRNLTRNGMQQMLVDKKAMTINLPIDEFEKLKDTFKKPIWRLNKTGSWECGEVGSWYVDQERSVTIYQESNLWGKI